MNVVSLAVGRRVPFAGGRAQGGTQVAPAGDRVDIQAGAVSRMAPAELWAELGRTGLLGATPAISGPIGASLTDATRQGLLDCVRRVRDSGKIFESWKGGRRTLTPEQVVDTMAKQRAEFDENAIVVSGFKVNAVFVMHRLNDLRGLDTAYGAGLEAAPPELLAARRSLDDLTALGWDIGEKQPSIPSHPGPANADEVFNHLAAPLYRGRGPRAASPQGWVTYLDSADHVAAVNYFHGSRVDRGMLAPERARAAQQLLDDGYLFRDLYDDENRDGAFAYRRGDDGFVGRAGRVMLPFDDAAARDVPAFEQRIALAEDVVARLFGSMRIAAATNDTDWYVGKALAPVLQPSPIASMRERVDALVVLALAELRRQPRQALYQIVDQARERLGRLEAVVRTPGELAACSQALGEMIADTPPDVPPYKVVDETMIALTRALAPPSPDAPRVERAADSVTIGGIRIPRRSGSNTAG